MSGQKPLDVRGILQRAGADPAAPEGTQAWALAQVDAAVGTLVNAATRAAVAAMRGDDNRPGTIRNADLDALRAALARVQGRTP